MIMPGRDYNAEKYRFGFNGKENDNEMKGTGNEQDYGKRVYDPRLGRFMSTDPLAISYPFYSPFQFSGNKPIWAVDLDGLEESGYTRYLDRQFASEAGARRVIKDNKEIAKLVYTPFVAAVFKCAFTTELPKKLIDNYVSGKGEPIKLNNSEMSQVNLKPFGLTTGSIPSQISKQIEGIVPGESRKVNFKLINAQAATSGTLGQFTVIGKGTYTQGEMNTWSFSGTMEFFDIYDFNLETNEETAARESNTGVGRSEEAQEQVQLANTFLPGENFEVTSEKVIITQTHKDKKFSWFIGKSSESIPNRETKVKNETK